MPWWVWADTIHVQLLLFWWPRYHTLPFLLSMKSISLAKSRKKGSPLSHKLTANFYPHMLNMSVMSWPRYIHQSSYAQSIRWNWTDDPHMNDPQLAPLDMIMKTETFLFSPPWSPQTLEGQPYQQTPLRKAARIVSAWLLWAAATEIIYSWIWSEGKYWMVFHSNCSAIAIYHSMNYNSPADKFVMTIHMP